ncbi:enamine deaminase RidA [Nocardia neocaledoniensis NBRC 108232]|uniref:Enamine deaminase RidA (YjgF/YER057c/UK114 family) n=1 Tax=Nocardia neocaledoniensis TaxID=236511 RepID=A0A317NJA1_9NOCA|nr:Rid family hydrolase [Nocardia neocaledoniensis]PWV75205.1 enamine deaminase RidA (YjgF/YER057c/UK114 family) [Nocardia neocaledoniensis]GEM31734.1 enamine deaminase RidA [Nocardia neocaledoniensis NBRC 108232]
MSVVITNPPELHDPTGFGYSHVARVTGELVLIAGQYDSDHEGHTTTTDFAGQVDRAFANLGIALRSAGASYADVAQLRTFIVDHDGDKLAILGAKIAEIWGERPPAQTLLGVAALALPGMLFEVDALAALS